MINFVGFDKLICHTNSERFHRVTCGIIKAPDGIVVIIGDFFVPGLNAVVFVDRVFRFFNFHSMKKKIRFIKILKFKF